MRYEDVVADVGYESLENDLYLDATGQACFIKPTSYDQEKRGSLCPPPGTGARAAPAVQCCRAKDPEQPKQLCLQKTFWGKRAETTQCITSQRDIHLRPCRSIQVKWALPY